MVAMVLLALAAGPSAGALKADLLVTNQPGTVLLGFKQRKPFQLENVKAARRGEPVAALVLLSACASDKTGNCDVRMDIVVLDPKGKTYGESKDEEVWTGKPAPSATATELGVGYMVIRIEPNDPPGRYKVKAHIMDRVDGTSIDREWTFEVAPAAASDTPAWPPDRPRPSLVGFWKDHCEDDFGLKIETAGSDLYSVSFCGPGGCFEPGTYRPNSPIYGDDSYRVIDASTIEVLGGDGFSKYLRCAEAK